MLVLQEPCSSMLGRLYKDQNQRFHVIADEIREIQRTMDVRED